MRTMIRKLLWLGWIPGAVLVAIGFLFVYFGGTERSMAFAVPGIVLLMTGSAIVGVSLAHDSD